MTCSAAMRRAAASLSSLALAACCPPAAHGPAAGSTAATTDLVKGCAARKVKIHAIGPTSIRCVTHKDVDAEDIGRTLDAFAEITRKW